MKIGIWTESLKVSLQRGQKKGIDSPGKMFDMPKGIETWAHRIFQENRNNTCLELTCFLVGRKKILAFVVRNINGRIQILKGMCTLWLLGSLNMDWLWVVPGDWWSTLLGVPGAAWRCGLAVYVWSLIPSPLAMFLLSASQVPWSKQWDSCHGASQTGLKKSWNCEPNVSQWQKTRAENWYLRSEVTALTYLTLGLEAFGTNLLEGFGNADERSQIML